MTIADQLFAREQLNSNVYNENTNSCLTQTCDTVGEAVHSRWHVLLRYSRDGYPDTVSAVTWRSPRRQHLVAPNLRITSKDGRPSACSCASSYSCYYHRCSTQPLNTRAVSSPWGLVNTSTNIITCPNSRLQNWVTSTIMALDTVLVS